MTYNLLTESTHRKCFVINNKNNFFIISSCHYLETSNEEIFVELNTGKIKLITKIIIPEIDLIIFPINNLKFEKYIDIENIKFNIDDIHDAYLINNSEMEIIEKLRLISERYNNLCLPEMLVYLGELKNKKNIEGLSGTPIFSDKNNIIGLVSSYDYESKLIMIIPFFFVFRILNEVIKHKQFNGLCYFKLDLKNNYISNSIEIDYNSYHKFNNYKINYLYKDDNLISIDDLKINDNKILCPLLNINIKINDYITIHKTIFDTNKFEIFRDSNKKKKKLDIITGNRDIKSCHSLNFNNYLLTDHLIDSIPYKEINPGLYRYIIDNKINIPSNILEHFINIPNNYKIIKYYSFETNKVKIL